MNATPEVHSAALQMCSRDWSKYLASRGTNTMPMTQQQAVDMCVLAGETLMTLMPDATVTLADAPDLSMPDSPGEQWVVKTAAGRTQFGFHYLWPDSAYEKKHYGPFDECDAEPGQQPAATYVPGPDGKPFAMRDPNAGHNQSCFQSRPAQQFYGALTLDQSENSLFYSVVNRDYGRYMISTAPVAIPVATRPTEGSYEESDGKFFISGKNDPQAMTVAQFGNVLLDPRFNDFLIRYEDYVLTHATADSFVVSGSKNGALTGPAWLPRAAESCISPRQLRASTPDTAAGLTLVNAASPWLDLTEFIDALGRLRLWAGRRRTGRWPSRSGCGCDHPRRLPTPPFRMSSSRSGAGC